MKIYSTRLISSLVSDEDYERAVVLLDIVVDQDRYPWIKLFAHTGWRCEVEGEPETGWQAGGEPKICTATRSVFLSPTSP